MLIIVSYLPESVFSQKPVSRYLFASFQALPRLYNNTESHLTESHLSQGRMATIRRICHNEQRQTETSDEPQRLYHVVNCAYGSQLDFVACKSPEANGKLPRRNEFNAQ